MYIAPPMSHACSAFAVAAFIATWLRVRDRWSAGGLAAARRAGRAHGHGPRAGRVLRRRARCWISHAPASGGRAGAIGPASPVSARCFARRASARSWRWPGLPAAGARVSASLNGYVGPSRLVARKMTWTAPHALRGAVLPRARVLLLDAAGAGRARRAARARAPASAGDASPRGSAVGRAVPAGDGRVQVYVAGSVESWTVAGAFGQRRFVGAHAGARPRRGGRC